ncbi:hypothetical protein LJC59_07960, partial [Desulfovibrio sp. OttesenSCG-928-A18]|nr:hypothetical protein [Desulfovibrio sp. OttesenSCG-928-A18]
MALNKRTYKREGRRVSLTRPGSKSGPARNTLREAKAPAKEFRIPWLRIRQFFSSAAFLSCLALFIATVGYTLTCGYLAMTRGQYFSL